MPIKFTNNASSLLASGITNSATSLTVTTGEGLEFPVLGASDYTYVTIVDAANPNLFEIVKVTARSTDTLTIVRAQEGTTARAWSTGAKVELRLTAQMLFDALAERLALESSGNLGIGISGAALAKLDLGIIGNPDEGAEIRMRGASSSSVDWVVDVYQSLMRFMSTDKGASSNTNVRVILDGATGNIAIGTSPGSFMFEVNGSTKFQTIVQSRLQSYRETVTTVTPAAGTATCDLSTANVFDLTLTGASTALAFSNPPASGLAFSFTVIVRQDATGNRALTYPASVKFTDAVTPVLATGASKVDVLTFFTVDGGTTYFGGQALANL